MTKIRVVFGAIVLVAVAMGGSVPASAAPSGAGSISGRVVDGDGNPVAGICVKVEKGDPVQSDETGAYAITGLDAGDYKVDFTDCNPSPQFVEQWYQGHATADGADVVSVGDATNTPLGDVTLTNGVVVAGTVTDPGGVPISGITVSVTPSNPGPTSTGTQTGGDGTYSTIPLAAGDYKVQFTDNNSPSMWAPQYWNQGYSWNTATTLQLSPTDGATRGGVDAHLTLPASIAGTVRGPDSNPLPNVCVDAYVPNNGGSDWVSGSSSGSDGTYSIGNLPATDIRVQFRDCQNGPYLNQWYAGQTNIESSTALVLAGGDNRTGIDAQMVQGIAVSGRVVDSDGNGLEGINVNVNPDQNGQSAWGQTDGDGNYTTGALPVGDYRVQFTDSHSDATWASQYWDGATGYNSATILTLGSGDGATRGGVNATLQAGASISGTVTSTKGPVGHLCVNAEVASGQGTDWVGGTNTAEDGTYTITGLPPTDVLIQFQDCNHVGPYAEQWWKNQPGFNTATSIPLTAGAHKMGIDATLTAAAEITGTITNRSGQPLEGICAQATTATFVGGMAHSGSDGTYAIELAKPGDYKVQFLDCSGAHKFAGQWWDNTTNPADAKTVSLAKGEIVKNIDAEMATGAVGTISGKIVNLNGIPVTAACVVAFAPNQFATFAGVNPDGTYTVKDLPSGTYALAFLGCNGGDPTPTVQDPQSSVTTYQGVWWKGAPVSLEQQSPDPIEQGATFVTVKPGQNLTGYDMCFGCTAIVITDITPGDGSLTVSFTTPGLIPAGIQGTAVEAAAVEPAATGFTYTVTCTSPTGATGTATGTSSPITVTGLTAGAAYTCTVTASDGSVTVASSSVSGAVQPVLPDGTLPVDVPVAPAAGGTSAGGSGGAGGTSGGVVAQMARTGSESSVQAAFGAALLAIGLALVLGTRARRSWVSTRS